MRLTQKTASHFKIDTKIEVSPTPYSYGGELGLGSWEWTAPSPAVGHMSKIPFFSQAEFNDKKKKKNR